MGFDLYLNVSEGEIAKWRCSSESSISSIPLFFLPQEVGLGKSWKAGTHLTTDVRDNVAVLGIITVLVLVVKLVVIDVDVLVDKLIVVVVLVVVVVYVLKKGLLLF